MKFADLHLHTHFSDGTFSPEELAGHGQRLGFAAMALTDHDSVEGCARMAAACGAAGIEFITGTELTAEHNDTEVHLLGYFVDTQNKRLLVETCQFPPATFCFACRENNQGDEPRCRCVRR